MLSAFYVWYYYLQKERLKCQMEYVEAVKKLEEKMVSNQKKHDRDSFPNGKCNGEVLFCSSFIML